MASGVTLPWLSQDHIVCLSENIPALRWSFRPIVKKKCGLAAHLTPFISLMLQESQALEAY